MCAVYASHCIPVPDTRKHIMTQECWCHPDEVQGVWIHRQHNEYLADKADGMFAFHGWD